MKALTLALDKTLRGYLCLQGVVGSRIQLFKGPSRQGSPNQERVKILIAPYQRPLSGRCPGTPFRGKLIGLNSWHANIVSVKQDFSYHSPYLP